MTYFNVFSNVLIVKGYSRMIICDLQRNVSELYPMDLYDLLEDLKKDSIQNIIESYDEESKEIFNQYMNLLIDKEYGFITENEWDKNFPELSYEYQDPSILSNIVIEFQDINLLYKIRESIAKLRISHLVIFSQRNLSKKDFKEIDNCFTDSCLEGIEIYAPYHEMIKDDFIKYVNQNTLRIYNLIFYNCDEFRLEEGEEIYRFSMSFIPEDLSLKSCGKVDLKYFSTNITKVLESINHNSCLHKKISIDKDGNIRNCPSMAESFGNIEDVTLEEALNKPSFKKYWNVTKDHIEVCKDCEFRYICTDCRAFRENPDNDYSKPLKCGYNPYTAEWEEWSKNPLKQKAIHFYGM